MKPKFISLKKSFTLLERIRSFLFPLKLEKEMDAKTQIPFEILLQNNQIVYNTPHANQSNKELKYAFHQLFYKEKIYQKAYDKVLVLGLGLGSVIQLLQEKCTMQTIVGVESNEAVLDILRKYYNIENVEMNCSDAGFYRDESLYDLIIIDVFEDDKIPKHLLNVVYISNIMKCLAPNGKLIWNILQHKMDTSILELFTRKVHVLSGNTFCIYEMPANSVSIHN